MILSDALQWIQGELQEHFGKGSSREAYALLLSLKRFKSMSQIIVQLKTFKLDSNEVKLLQNWVQRRSKGEPLAYLRGYEYHYGRKFLVNENVLIPRPETELITQRCVQIYKTDGSFKDLQGLDIGTGSGVLCLSLKLELPQSNWLATDISIDCLKITEKNSRRLNANVKLLQSYCARGLKGLFDIIVSNPPYIAMGDPLVQKEVDQYEPHLALYAEQEGLELIYEILNSMLKLLSPEGRGFIEIGYNQHKEIESKLSDIENIQISWIRDFANIPRILEIKRDAKY